MTGKHTFAVCAHGTSPFLAECVRSVVEQDEPSNVIICTSTPNEHIQEIADQYSLPLFVNPTETDMQGSWNFALASAETEFITICHQDDIYGPAYYKTIRPLLDQPDVLYLHTANLDQINGKTCVLLSTRIRAFLSSPLRFRILQGLKAAKWFSLAFGNSVTCPSCTYRKSARPVPFFRSALQFSLDWDLYADFVQTHGRVVYVPKRLITKRFHTASETTNAQRTDQRYREDLYMFCRFWPKWIALLLMKLYVHAYQSAQ